MTDILMPPKLDQSQPEDGRPQIPDPEARAQADVAAAKRRARSDIDPIEACVVLLHAIHKTLLKIFAGNEPFQLTIIVNSQAGTTGFNSPSRQGGTGAAGVVRFIHNPTAAALTLSLVDGDNRLGLASFNASLAAGESRPVWIPFTTDLMASSGSGCQIAGYYRP